MRVEKRIISQEEEVYLFQDDTGNAQLQVYKVFPGIEVIYNRINMDKCSMELPEHGEIVEIRHCSEGRMEQWFEDGGFYLMPGDLSVSLRKCRPRAATFPTKHYHGITIGIHPGLAPECLSCFLEGVRIKPLKVANRLCHGKNCFVARKRECIEHIFANMYTASSDMKGEYRKGYFRLKVMEILMELNGMDARPDKPVYMPLPRSQVELARKIASYLEGRMEGEVTVSQLAESFHLSKSHLQNLFHDVYGTSVSRYIRIQKMQSASCQLMHTDLSVGEIANNYGYDNASKFSAAFREVMGEAPMEYRRMGRKRRRRSY